MTRGTRVVMVVGLAVQLVALVLLASFVVGQRPVPRCTEDAVVMGYGEFDRGRWSHYECGPSVDDYTPRDLRDTDFQALAEYWQAATYECEDRPAEDVNRDGTVNALDVQLVVNAYLVGR